ncbi:HNH endonuclease [Bacillus timonensis]|nr:HNH endonuclease [Bacillus timonensis]
MGRKSKSLGICELCHRENVEVTIHHLTPKEMGGTFEPTAQLCIPCHKHIHAVYTNDELAIRLNTIPALQADEKISSFIKWIQKQPPGKLPKIKKANERKRKNK